MGIFPLPGGPLSDHRLEYISRLSRLSHLLFSDPNLPPFSRVVLRGRLLNRLL